MEKETHQQAGADSLLAAMAFVGAIAASSCCVLPLIFVSIGISGAWIGALTALAPYQPMTFGISGASIAAGFWLARRRRQLFCTTPDCGTPMSRRVTMAALWAGLVLWIVAGSAGWWARLLT